jgi:hypothetical protein
VAKSDTALRLSKLGLALVALTGITTACSNSSVVMPLSCPVGNVDCQRNLDAQTLSYIGQGEAALKLMCLDSTLFDILSEECLGDE